MIMIRSLSKTMLIYKTYWELQCLQFLELILCCPNACSCSRRHFHAQCLYSEDIYNCFTASTEKHGKAAVLPFAMATGR